MKKDVENWKAIEYFVHSTCGNSYAEIELPNGFCLDGLIAKYIGDFKTKLRVKLLFNGQITYSNIYDGKINKSQFESDATNPDGSF